MPRTLKILTMLLALMLSSAVVTYAQDDPEPESSDGAVGEPADDESPARDEDAEARDSSRQGEESEEPPSEEDVGGDDTDTEAEGDPGEAGPVAGEAEVAGEAAVEEPAPELPSPEPAQMRACDHWGEWETAECERRAAVRSVDGVSAAEVRPPIERPRHSALKRVLRATVKGVFWLPRMAVTVLLIPIRGTVTMVSRYKVIEHTIDLLYNDARTAAIIPLFGFESGFGMTGGATAFHSDLFGNGERISATARFGGRYVQGYQLRLGGDHILGAPVWADFLGRYESNPRLLFAGIGPPTSPGLFGFDREESYYAQERALGTFAGGVSLGRRGKIQPGLRGILNARRFEDPQRRARRTPISSVYDTETLVGFQEGLNTFELQALLRVDARKYAGLWRRGLWFETFVGGARAPESYVHWGGELTLDVPIWRDTRIISFRVAVEGVNRPADEVPFAELPRLGGPDRLRGYPADAYRDSHMALGSVEYSYPIHKNASGNLFLDIGRVAPSVDDFVSATGWRMGGGGGVLIGSEDSVTFRLSVAGGSSVQVLFATDFARAFDGRSEQL